MWGSVFEADGHKETRPKAGDRRTKGQRSTSGYGFGFTPLEDEALLGTARAARRAAEDRGEGAEHNRHRQNPDDEDEQRRHNRRDGGEHGQDFTEPHGERPDLPGQYR